MIDLVTKSFLSSISEQFKPYYPLYATYLPVLSGLPDVYKREALLSKYMNNLKEDLSSTNIVGYSRSSVVLNENRRNMSHSTVYGRSSTDVTQMGMTDFKMIKFTDYFIS